MKPIYFIFSILLSSTIAFYVEETISIAPNSQSNSVVQAGGFLYFGTEYSIVELDIENETVTYTLNTIEELSLTSFVFVDEDDDSEYIIFGGYDGIATKFDPVSKAANSVYFEDDFGAAVQWGNYGFFGGYCVSTVELYSFTIVGEYCGPYSGDLGFMDGFAYGDFVYFTASANGILVKYNATNPDDYTVIDGLSDDWLYTATVVGDYAYIGTWAYPNPGQLLKFNLLTETVEDSITLPDYVVSASFAVGNYIYAGDGYLTQIHLGDFTITKTITLPGASLRDAAVVGTHAYLSSYADDKLVWKVNIDTSCTWGEIQLNDGDTVDVYSESQICASSCDSVKGSITCKNRVLTGDILYSHTSCTPNPSCSCYDKLGSVILSHGESKDVYLRPGACGETTCDQLKGSITCQDGVLVGNTDYNWDSCEGSACSCEDAPGGILHSGDSRHVARKVGAQTVPNQVYCYDGILYRQEYPNMPGYTK